jgi:regulator of RNase E activity RraA
MQATPDQLTGTTAKEQDTMFDVYLIRDQLSQVSTATLATILFRRGLRNQFVQGVKRLGRKRPKAVGPVYTLRYIPAREDIDVVSVFRDPEHPQRKACETIPPGSVLVMDCRGDASAASAGSILLTRLMVRGCAGVVTDGGLRDADIIAELDMPSFCATRSAPTNLTKHHAVDIDVPIACGGVAVYPGDWAVGDGDGVIIVPQHLVAEIATEAVEQERLEDFIAQQIAAGAPLSGTYPPGPELLARYRASLDPGGAEGQGEI